MLVGWKVGWAAHMFWAWWRRENNQQHPTDFGILGLHLILHHFTDWTVILWEHSGILILGHNIWGVPLFSFQFSWSHPCFSRCVKFSVCSSYIACMMSSRVKETLNMDVTVDILKIRDRAFNFLCSTHAWYLSICEQEVLTSSILCSVCINIAVLIYTHVLDVLQHIQLTLKAGMQTSIGWSCVTHIEET
jgi:hypothetical protein